MGSEDVKVSVIVPAFNEEEHIHDNLTRLLRRLDASWPNSSELIMIDDGSTDATRRIAQELAEREERLTVIGHKTNLGLGMALRTGFRAARGDYLVTFDADLSYGLDLIDSLVSTIHATGCKVVVASPYMEGGTVSGVPRLRAWLSRIANGLLRRLSNSHVSTVTGMVRAYDRRFLQMLSLKAVDNQINAEIIYKTELMREGIVEIPAHLRWTRTDEDTKRRKMHLSLLRTSVDFAFSGFIFRPFLFFVLPGVMLLLLAVYTLSWSLFHVIRFLGGRSGGLDSIISAAVADAFAFSPHSFVVGGLAAIFAVQLIGFGIMAAQSKRYFEELFHLNTFVRAGSLPSASTSDPILPDKEGMPSG